MALILNLLGIKTFNNILDFWPLNVFNNLESYDKAFLFLIYMIPLIYIQFIFQPDIQSKIILIVILILLCYGVFFGILSLKYFLDKKYKKNEDGTPFITENINFKKIAIFSSFLPLAYAGFVIFIYISRVIFKIPPLTVITKICESILGALLIGFFAIFWVATIFKNGDELYIDLKNI